jgi:hypothetical protein
MDSGLLLVGGSRIDLRLARIRAQGGGKRTFGGFCAVRQYLGAVGEIGGSLPMCKVFKSTKGKEKKRYLSHLNIQLLLIKVCLGETFDREFSPVRLGRLMGRLGQRLFAVHVSENVACCQLLSYPWK